MAQWTAEVRWILTAVLNEGHWTPVVLSRRSQTVNVHVWEFDGLSISHVQSMCGQLCVAWGVPNWTLSCNRRTFGRSLCGASVVAYFESMLNQVTLPSSEQQLMEFHVKCKAAFKAACVHVHTCLKPWCWGAGPPDVHSMLQAVLKLHGVPDQQLSSRTKLVLQSLGREPVMHALSGASPWKALKTLANQHQPVLQLVLQEEQTQSGLNRPHKKNKQSASSSVKPMPKQIQEIDASKLSLADGSFRIHNDEVICQLPLSQINPLAQGIALASYSDALPFLKSGQLLTHQGLAILVINHPVELQTKLVWNTLRFAAKCDLNGEPVLLSGALVQLGRVQVYQFCQKEGVQIQSQPVACARLTAFRDQWEGDWSHFQQQPVKTLFKWLKPLQVCTEDPCTCGRWRPNMQDETEDAVLDVFRRHFYNDSGRPVSGESATHYGVMIRYVKQQERALLLCSGMYGIYVEPRTPDAQSPSDEFQVVWLSDNFKDIQHKSQCETASIGLARNGPKFGIRVEAAMFQSAFQRLKPESLFLAPGKRSTYHCGPWPYGTDRKQLAKVFKDWKWDARPLQPVRSVQDGLMWSVQAITEPSEKVYPMKHGQVVVTKGAPELEKAVVPEVIAAQQTKQLCQLQQSASVDLLQEFDPWKGAVTKAAPAQVDVTTQLNDLECRLEKSILAKLPAENMETDAQDQRLTALEQQLAVLTDRQKGLENTVQDHHAQNQAQVQNIQTQMMAQLDVQGKKMQCMLDDQMQRLESVLTRRVRSRSRHE